MIKKLTGYPEIIAQNDSYKTDEKRHKRVVSPSFYFYRNLLRVVLYSNKKVKKGIYDRYNWVGSSLEIMRNLEEAGLKFDITGMSNIQKIDGPVIFIGNHMSTLETLVLPGIIQPVKPVIFIIKKELVDFPLFGPIAAARHPIIVGRTNPREDFKLVMDEGKKRLEEGRSIVVFPQKTRTPFLDSSSFNTMGIKLAKRNNVPVIPIALATDAWPNGKIVKDIGKLDPSKTVHFAFGEPLTVTGSGTEEHQKVLNFIKGKLTDWGRSNLIVN